MEEYKNTSPNKNNDMEEKNDKTYYMSVAYLQEPDAKEYLDKYRESGSDALLYEAANWDQGDDIVQSQVYSYQGVHPGDITLVQDENYALVYNPAVGGDYEVLRKVSEQDIRRNIERYGLETDAADAVKKIAYAMVKEEFQKMKQEPTLEMPSGDILSFQYNVETNKIEVGTVTNAGLAPLHEFDYDHDYTIEENIGDIYSKLSDMEEYQEKESTVERVSFDNKEDMQNYIKDYCEKHGWDSDLNHIDTSNIRDMSLLFEGTKFTGDISKWNTSKVVDMSDMFLNSAFNGYVNDWDVSNVEDMHCIFSNTPFNQPLDKWDTSSVKDMSGMFYGSQFNHPIGNWDTGNVKDMNSMFAHGQFNQPINNWNTSNVKDMHCMFSDTPFNQPLDNWDTSNVMDMEGMFAYSSFTHPLDKWVVSTESNKDEMFIGSPLEGKQEEFKASKWGTKKYTLPDHDPEMLHEESSAQVDASYSDLKKKHPNAIIACKGADGRYRIFKDDADYVARELGIALEKRLSDGLSMITFTQKEFSINLPKIIKSGKKAAVIDGTPFSVSEVRKAEEETPKEVSPLDKWREIKAQNPDKVVLLREDGRNGHYYVSWDKDALEICKALRVSPLRDTQVNLPVAYWRDTDDDSGKFEKVVSTIANLSVWDIINPVTQEARPRVITRDEQEQPSARTWQDLKEEDPKNVVLTLKDGRYHAYQDDAKAVSKLLGLDLTKREDYVMTTSFPATALDVYGKRIKASGHKLVLTNIDYFAPVERDKAENAANEAKPEVDPIERWKELKAQNSDKITLMRYSTGYLTIGKDADAIPADIGVIHEKFDTPLGTGIVVSALYRDLDRLQQKVGPLAVWDDVNTRDIKVTYYPSQEQGQAQGKMFQDDISKGKQEGQPSVSPVRQMWETAKKEHPDKVVLLRSGDFYHTYEDDARRASSILGITLTKNTKENCYMAGFPVNFLDEFMHKFNKAQCAVELRNFEKDSQTVQQHKTEEGSQEYNSEKVAALKGPAYQAYLLDKALGFAQEAGGVFVNNRKMSAPVMFPHDISIPAFNQVIMTLHTERMSYASNTYTTFKGARSMGMSVKRDEKSLGINNYGISYFVNTFNKSDVIPKGQYKLLPEDQKQQYRPANKVSGFRDRLLLFNLDQTNAATFSKDFYKNMVRSTHRENKSKSTMDNVKRYDELLRANPTSIPLFRTGHSYETYKDGAVALAALLALPVMEDKKKRCKVASFPSSKMDEYLPIIAKQYHTTIIDSSDIINGKTTIDYCKEASDFVKQTAKNMGVAIDKTTYMLTTYNKKDDTISLHVNNLDPGKPNSTDIKDINAMYRALSQAVEIPDRLDRSGRIVLNYGDCEKYDALVTEIVAAAFMIKQGLPARISEENMQLIPYWQRELRENPNMITILELNANATMKAIMRHYEGKDVDYSKLRGTSQRRFLPEQDYSIVKDLATYSNVENRSAVIVRDSVTKEASVILPAGASTEVKNEIPGMNKHRYELALKKEGYERVSFYNADGFLSLNQPNSFFQDKVVTVEQLHQYDLNEVLKLDLSQELARYEKPAIERIRGLKNDEGHYELYVKPVDKPEFTVRAQYADVTAFYKSFDNPNKKEGEEIRKAIGQKYYELVQIQPEHLTTLLKPNTEGINIDRLESVNVTKDPETKKPVFSVKIDGKRYEKTVPNEIWQRFWTTSDPAAYKRAYAAVLFEKELGRVEMLVEGVSRDTPVREEKKGEPVAVQSQYLSCQENDSDNDIVQDDKKETRRGGRGR